jgi:hypothetical protein
LVLDARTKHDPFDNINYRKKLFIVMVSQVRKKKFKEKERYESQAYWFFGNRKEHYVKNRDISQIDCQKQI